MLEHQNYFASEWHLFPFTGELRLCLVCSTYTHFKNKHAVDHTFILAETHLCNNIMQTLYCFKNSQQKFLGYIKQPSKYGIFYECYFEPWKWVFLEIDNEWQGIQGQEFDYIIDFAGFFVVMVFIMNTLTISTQNMPYMYYRALKFGIFRKVTYQKSANAWENNACVGMRAWDYIEMRETHAQCRRLESSGSMYCWILLKFLQVNSFLVLKQVGRICFSWTLFWH